MELALVTDALKTRKQGSNDFTVVFNPVETLTHAEELESELKESERLAKEASAFQSLALGFQTLVDLGVIDPGSITTLLKAMAESEEGEGLMEKLFEEIQEGETRRGVVSNLCDFGAFVDLGGADGLIHISELAWNRVKHPRDVLQVGQEVEVFVLRVERERQRIALSLKRLQEDPWRAVEDKYHVGQTVWATITNIVKFGAFAEVEPGIEGLIHLSELLEGGVQDASDVVYEGQKLQLQVVSIDSARQRIGLSLRRVPVEEVEAAEAEEEAGETGVEPEPGEDATPEGEQEDLFEADVASIEEPDEVDVAEAPAWSGEDAEAVAVELPEAVELAEVEAEQLLSEEPAPMEEAGLGSEAESALADLEPAEPEETLPPGGEDNAAEAGEQGPPDAEVEHPAVGQEEG